jgi:hypothetical protein
MYPRAISTINSGIAEGYRGDACVLVGNLAAEAADLG